MSPKQGGLEMAEQAGGGGPGGAVTDRGGERAERV